MALCQKNHDIVNVTNIGNIGNSDHAGILLDMLCTGHEKIKTRYARDWKNGDSDGLSKFIRDKNWKRLLEAEGNYWPTEKRI